MFSYTLELHEELKELSDHKKGGIQLDMGFYAFSFHISVSILQVHVHQRKHMLTNLGKKGGKENNPQAQSSLRISCEKKTFPDNLLQRARLLK